MEEFPQEYFIELENEPNYLGRIIVNQRQEGVYDSEVDIVHKKTKKIYHHVTILLGRKEKDEAIHSARFLLAKFLKE